MAIQKVANDAGSKASSVSFVSAVMIVIAGMVWGIVMAISQDHSTHPAHAHLNLLGWVSLFLFGVFYHLHPAIDHSRLAMAQVVIWVVATIVMIIGVALIHTGRTIGDPIAAVGSLGVLAAMLIFAWLVVRRGRFVDHVGARASLAPAE